jgi:hypothetical protein
MNQNQLKIQIQTTVVHDTPGSVKTLLGALGDSTSDMALVYGPYCHYRCRQSAVQHDARQCAYAVRSTMKPYTCALSFGWGHTHMHTT